MRPSRGIRKHRRTQKAFIRRRFLDPEDQKREITYLYARTRVGRKEEE